MQQVRKTVIQFNLDAVQTGGEFECFRRVF